MGTDPPQISAVDFLVVGQGMAGTMMAWHLVKAGKSVSVVDDGLPSASKVAAGLFNPVTGRRFVKSWLIDDLLPYAETVYRDLELKLGRQFLYKVPIVRFLSGPEEKMVYERAQRADNHNYIEGFAASSTENKFASCEIKGGGYVDTDSLIVLFHKYLAEQGMFIEDDFRYKDVELSGENIKWKGHSAKAIIFCEGYKATDNPYFPGLPFNLAKGEILTVSIPELKSEKILMSGGYLVPIGDDIYKLGSTYEWDDLSPDPTEKGKETLVNLLKRITDLPFEIIGHEAGVRPAVKNRRPILGQSSVNENMFILNGMGTKGVILAPFFAKQLTDYILDGKALDKEVDVHFQ